VSEGTIYNYFASKEDLFLCTLTQLRSGFVTLMRELHERAGTGTVSSTLSSVAQSALDFYDEAIPMGASFFADPISLPGTESCFPSGALARNAPTKPSPAICGPSNASAACAAMPTPRPSHTCCLERSINMSTGGNS
jgi:AcrR family transcriptional regulator